MDHRLLLALRDCGTNPRIATATRALSRIGEHGALWLAAGLAGAAADRPRRAAWLRGTALIGAAHLAGAAVKQAVRRPRPRLPDRPPLVGTVGGHSFPSAHATSAAAAVVALRGLAPPGTRTGAGLRTALPVLAGAVCVSRVVAGVHYPTDIAAGVALGALTARLGAGWMHAAGAGTPGSGAAHGGPHG
ncbi:phosphatase PAP2 family protein [Streptomyces sp. YGL11-2]|uniref:phosphatase PAP2 family protein n=1 Tax=Streptomyces sp. YGL11-2 TaxID=3414028 RepID=UPI003CED90CC